MLSKCFVFALVAVGMAAASSINYPQQQQGMADRDMLMKQKKVFDLLMYVGNSVHPDAEYYEIGRNYDVMGNIDYYTDKEVVQYFMMYYKTGFIQRDTLFTYYKQEHREEMMMLYRLFYSAKDFMTFYKTACWARVHMNSGLFNAAFTTAVIYRDDTKYIRLPVIYEIYPNLFFDSRTIYSAQRMMMSRGMTEISRNYNMKGEESGNAQTFYVQPYFETCTNPMYYQENKLSYFMNDIDLNAYYYYFRMMFPFFMNTKEYNVPKSFRGDFYYFFHQQIMARYYLERFSNGLGELEDFTWNKMDLPGFYSNYVYANGIPLLGRDWWNYVPMYKQKYLEYLQKLEIRIMEAIDSGYVIDESGKQVDLIAPEGLNYLGNLIEGNYDSVNMKYYGSYDALARDVLGMNVATTNKDMYIPSALQLFGTSMRDPAFYRLYNKIVQFFLRYKSFLPRYTKQELEFTGVRIENVEYDKFFTYFEKKEYLINNAVDVPTFKDGKSFNLKAYQYHLNYKPFSYKFAINSDKSTKAVMRIFLGPAYEGEKYDDYTYFFKYYKYFFMLDEFEMNLNTGMNNYERKSTDSYFFKGEYMTGDYYYQKMMKAMEGGQQFQMSDRMWGFPAHLMLPKGSVEGMRFKLFFYIGEYQDSKPMELPFFGQRNYYGKSFGFPLDRPMYPWMFQLGNVYYKDAYIFTEAPYGYSKNMMMDYEGMMKMNSYDYMKAKYGSYDNKGFGGYHSMGRDSSRHSDFNYEFNKGQEYNKDYNRDYNKDYNKEYNKEHNKDYDYSMRGSDKMSSMRGFNMMHL